MSASSSKQSLLGLCGSLTGLSILAVGLRFWIRRQRKMPLMLDDWTVVAALCWYIGASICIFTMVHNKDLGYSSHDFTPEQTSRMGKTSNIGLVVYDVLTNSTLAFVKLSALFFYRRIFLSSGVPSRSIAILWTTGIVVVAWLICFQFLAGFQCGTHFSALWDGTYLRYCTISFPFLYGLVVSDFLLDIWILLIPIPVKRLYVVGVFLLAFAGLGASIARMVQYIKIELGGPDYLLYTDQERLLTQSVFYTMLECGMVLIAVNLPSLHAIVHLLGPARSFIVSGETHSIHLCEQQFRNQSSETQLSGKFGKFDETHVQQPVPLYFPTQAVGDQGVQGASQEQYLASR